MGYNDDHERQRREDDLRIIRMQEQDRAERQRREYEEQERRSQEADARWHKNNPSTARPLMQTTYAPAPPDRITFKPYDSERAKIFTVLFAGLGALIAANFQFSLPVAILCIIAGAVFGRVYREGFFFVARLGLFTVFMGVLFTFTRVEFGLLVFIAGLLVAVLSYVAIGVSFNFRTSSRK